MVEVLVDRIGCRTTDREDCCDPGPPHIKEPGIKPGIQFSGYFLGDIERQRRFCQADDLYGLRYQLAPAGRLVDCLHGTSHPDDRFAGDCFHRGKDSLGDLFLGDGYLEDAGPVADQQEGKAAEIPYLVDPAADLCVTACRRD